MARSGLVRPEIPPETADKIRRLAAECAPNMTLTAFLRHLFEALPANDQPMTRAGAASVIFDRIAFPEDAPS
jgi:hypothetical protein